MGALDFLKEFENRAIDAATYKLLERNFQMQEDHSRLLNEKCNFLAQENTRLKADISSLTSELEALRRIARESEFSIQSGIAFKRLYDGSFDVTPYCPNCHVVLGNPLRQHYHCNSCGYKKQSQVLPETLAGHLEHAVVSQQAQKKIKIHTS